MKGDRDWANEGCEPDDVAIYCHACGKYDDDCSCDVVTASDFCAVCGESDWPCRCEMKRIMDEEIEL